MAVKTLQRSFAAGEISEECHGRLDLTRYQSGLAIARNFFTTPHGPAVNRAGTKYILETKDSTKRSVLLPFSYNTEQTYTLEFGDQYIRFHLAGGTLLEATQNITGISQANPGVVTYTGADPANGDWVYLTGVGGMTQANGRFFKVAGVNAGANTFQLTSVHGGANINTTGYGAYTAGGTMAPVYEIASPYLEADLYELHIAQSADVMTITHPDYAPRELRRNGAATWEVVEVDFKHGPLGDKNTDLRNNIYVTTPMSVEDGGINVRLVAQAAAFTASMVGRVIRLGKNYFNGHVKPWAAGEAIAAGEYRFFGNNYYVDYGSGGTSGATPPTHTEGVASDGTLLWRYWDSGSVVMEIVNFVSTTQVDAFMRYDFKEPIYPLTIGSGPTTLLNTFNHNGDGATVTFACAGITQLPASRYVVTVGGGYKIPFLEYFVDAAADTITFVEAPPVGVNNVVVREYTLTNWTFDWTLGAWYEDNYPSAVSYFGGRIAYAGTEAEPQDLWLSKAGGQYTDFGTTPLLADDEAIDLRIADRQVNRVRDLVALKHLVAMTSSRTWQVVGDENNVLTPAATVDPGDAVGISTVQAEVVGNQALYVDAVGNAIHKLYLGVLQSGEQGYLSEDLSILAEHLTREKTIIDIAFQRKPYPILWCVRSDGVLLGLTHNARHEVVAWHQHITNGEFESVAVINEGTEDAVYFVVKRTVNGRTCRNVERMASRRFTALEDCFFVDAGLTYDGAANDVITGLHHLEGEEVVGLADGVPFTATVEDGAIELADEAELVHIGLSFTADLQTLPLALQAEGAGQGYTKNVTAAHLRFIDSAGMKVGPSFEAAALDEPLLEETENPLEGPVLVNGRRRVPLAGDWGEDGQVCLRQSLPLPVMVSSLVLEVALGG